MLLLLFDRLSCLVVRITGYTFRGAGFGSWRYHISWPAVALEWGPFSLLWITEKLLGETVAASVWKTEINCHGDIFALTKRRPFARNS
jgi:hypothetical protein